MPDTITYPKYQTDFGQAFWVRNADSDMPDAIVMDLHQSFTDFKQNEKNQQKYFSQEQTYAEQGFEGKSYQVNSTFNLELLLLVLLIVYLAVVKYFKSERIGMLLMAPLNYGRPETVEKEGDIYNEPIGFPLLLNHLICSSIILFLGIDRFIGINIFPFEGFQLLGICFLSILVLYSGKFFFVGFSSIVFNLRALRRIYLGTFAISTGIQGLYLLPITLLYLVLHHDIFFFLAIFWISITFVYRLFQIFSHIRHSFGFSVFHNILYLCTLEILPIGLLAKALLEVH